MFKNFSMVALTIAICLLATSCATKILPPADAWTLRQGQATWHNNQLDLAGDLIVATAPNRLLIEFSKGPVPAVSATRAGRRWQIEFFSNRKYSGRGTPPKRIAWFHLAEALEGKPTPNPWSWSRTGDRWKLENTRTREMIEGFLNE
jgi:hypothetical protein